MAFYQHSAEQVSIFQKESPFRKAFTRMDRWKSTLSSSRQRLLQAMQRNPFSNIETLIKGGEPCFNPPPTIIREIKLGTRETECRAEQDADFALKRAVVDLFEQFDRLKDGSVRIECRH